ncbi:site-specific integrase, partial [bacterium]|nr:site-specific integrase [bacterium]
RLPKVSKPKPYRQNFAYLKNDNQIRAFLESAKDHGEGPHAFFATAIFTGMRAGELFGLRWADVDLERRLITVRRSFDKPTKSGHVRHVPILDVLYPVLRSWRLQNANDLVFPNAAGNMHTPSPRLVKETFPAILKTAKLPPMRFHDLRHTFASQWVMRGGDLFKLQKILGHADQQMVQRYAHLAPEAFDSDRNIFGTDAPQADNVATLRAKTT